MASLHLMLEEAERNLVTMAEQIQIAEAQRDKALSEAKRRSMAEMVRTCLPKKP